ncbi:ATP-binding protein [Streptomyces sp. NBC_01476]|uniref:ATP-binding protein n=1 Tax=Streptomyces sp. NBC_01476 TaxID=2903881 RepID=UPI002E35D631|nr:ATP-binding protein [Streptomyces sp. NBC_01476]
MKVPSLPQTPLTVRTFVQCFRATELGARLARQVAVAELDGWGVPRGSDPSDTAALLVAELAANAVTHGHVPGRDIELRLSLDAGTLVIEVSDARGERRPPTPGTVAPADPLAQSGRGLFLVDTLASRWTVLERAGIGKTLHAELDLPSP